MRRLNKMFYLACAIESNTEDPEAHTWKNAIKDLAAYSNSRGVSMGVYDPIEQEKQKTGKDFKEACQYSYQLKLTGRWTEFLKIMREIWWGYVQPRIGNKISILQYFKNTASIKGNFLEKFGDYGDYEAVCRSDALIVYLQKGVQTVGTLFEVHTAYLLDIPIYLILPDQSETEANSSLIAVVRESRGYTFYSVVDCVKFLNETYVSSKVGVS
jgi:hypothetical protein